MAKFRYQARTRSGQVLQGVMEVEDRETAARRLRQQGYYVTSLRQVAESSLLKLLEPRGFLKAKHLALLCRQFAIELEAGMSLVKSLELLEDQSHEARLKKALQQIRLDLSSGIGFTKALDKHRHLFPNVFVHLVEAGETAGALPEVFERLAIYYEREDELRKKISEAVMYPAVIVTVAVVMVFVLMFFVLPMLVANFSSFGVQPPPLTQAVLDARDVLADYWYAFVLWILAMITLVRWYLRTPRGEAQRDWVLLRAPLIGQLQLMVIFSRFSRALGLLLSSGVSMMESLDIVGRLIPNRVINKTLREARNGVERGQGLSAPLQDKPFFPVMVVQMIAVGEETGNLEKTLYHLSDYYDREVNFTVANVTKVLEPAIMLVLAVVVLFILISIYLPMMQMVTQL